jgi:hypothetical protein
MPEKTEQVTIKGSRIAVSALTQRTMTQIALDADAVWAE